MKVISFCLWIQFCGAGNSSKTCTKVMRHVLSTPTCLDHMSPVKVDINKTYLYTGKTRCSKQIQTQPRLQINLKIPTTKGHQVLLLTTKLKYSKVNQKGHDEQFCPLHFLFPGNGSKINFSGL